MFAGAVCHFATTSQSCLLKMPPFFRVVIMGYCVKPFPAWWIGNPGMQEYPGKENLNRLLGCVMRATGRTDAAEHDSLSSATSTGASTPDKLLTNTEESFKEESIFLF